MSYNPTIGRFMERDPEGYVDGMNSYEALRSNPIRNVDPFGLAATTQPTTQPADDNLDSSSAWEHYKNGPDDPKDSTKRTPKHMPFSKIDTSAVKPTDFAKVKAEVDKGQGDREVKIDDKLPFATSGDQSLFLGNITLRLQGTFKAKGCDWSFEGTLKSYDDLYDFNASTHRGIIGETLTKIGANTPGKPYWIEIRGQKDAKQTGTFSAPPKSNPHQSSWYYY